MWRRLRPPLAVVALALFALLVLLAVLQYRWLGQISDAERAQRRATLATGAANSRRTSIVKSTRAYLLFQADGPFAAPAEDDVLTERFAARYDRWQATARFPRLLKEFYAVLGRRCEGACPAAALRSRDTTLASGRLARAVEELARAARGGELEGRRRQRRQHALHSPDAAPGLGKRAGDRRARADHSLRRAEARLRALRRAVGLHCSCCRSRLR